MKSVYEIADVRRLTTDDSIITLEGDFPVLSLREEDGWRRVGIVTVKRAFPFEAPDEFIVLADEEDRDCGFIRALAERTPEERALLERELERRYFMPKIGKILKVTDRFGFSYWSVETDKGHLEFSVKDTFKSLIRLGDRLIVTDADGSRYDIPSVSALDKSSRKKIDLYLN